MDAISFLVIGKKLGRIYEGYCTPVHRKYGVSQTALDILLFLANNTGYNTARDIYRIRGIKSGIASVTVESLIQAGYLRRENDPNDRRVQRLILLPKSDALVEDGRAAQRRFAQAIMQNLSTEEQTAFASISSKLMETINTLDAGEKKND